MLLSVSINDYVPITLGWFVAGDRIGKWTDPKWKVRVWGMGI